MTAVKYSIPGTRGQYPLSVAVECHYSAIDDYPSLLQAAPMVAYPANKQICNDRNEGVELLNP